MTQGPGNRSYSSQRRANRGGRAKPTLVTTTTNEDIDNDQLTQNGDALLAESDVAVEDQDALIAPPEPAPAPASSRKLPRFFSTVGRSEKAKEVSDEEAAQARIARATRSKTATKAAASATTSSEVETSTTKTSASKETAPAQAPTRTRANAPARPPSPFKTKYIIGMVVYLLGAQFIGTFERNFFVSNHMDSVLTQFNLFGLPFTISASTLAFLATLIILLVVLAKFDFLPRSLSALGGQPAPRRGTTTSRSSSNDIIRTPQPTMKQGVSGEDDDLYREYRTNQRRTRKK